MPCGMGKGQRFGNNSKMSKSAKMSMGKKASGMWMPGKANMANYDCCKKTL